MRIYRKTIDTDQLLLAYYSGKSAVAIASLFDCTRTTIGNEFKRLGLKPRKCGNGGMIAERNPNWNGGTRIDRGYVLVRVGKNKYRQEHRIVMERKIGRPLLNSEVVHHIDGNTLNNAPENLELLASQSEHMKEHMTTERARRMQRLAFCAFAGIAHKRDGGEGA